MKKKEIYTFEDWLENNFWDEEGYSGQLMVNDSENYLDLVFMGKMTYETLNKIQDAQSKTYQYILDNTLETNKKFLKTTKEQSLDFDKYLGLLIEKIELDLEENKDLYFEVIRPKLHRRIKYGAKFLLPEEFKKFENHEFIDGYLPVFAPYSIFENGQMKHFPEDEQRKFLRMEVQFYWLNYLREVKKAGKIESEPIEEIRQEPRKLILEQKETKLSEKVKKHLGFMLGNCPRKGIPILKNKKDFDNLVNWTTYFFENNFEVPEILEPIKSVNTNDYFTQLAFLYLFDELRVSGYHAQRTRAKTLFNLWESCFAKYNGYSESNFWKVKHENGKEVKKLMLIDK